MSDARAEPGRGEVTVHILYQGKAMCGFHGAPHQWPPEHRGVPMTEHYKANCNECFNEWLRFHDE